MELWGLKASPDFQLWDLGLSRAGVLSLRLELYN